MCAWLNRCARDLGGTSSRSIDPARFDRVRPSRPAYRRGSPFGHPRPGSQAHRPGRRPPACRTPSPPSRRGSWFRVPYWAPASSARRPANGACGQNRAARGTAGEQSSSGATSRGEIGLVGWIRETPDRRSAFQHPRKMRRLQAPRMLALSPGKRASKHHGIRPACRAGPAPSASIRRPRSRSAATRSPSYGRIWLASASMLIGQRRSAARSPARLWVQRLGGIPFSAADAGVAKHGRAGAAAR